MYRLDADQVLRVPAWDALFWLQYGFGTRKSPEWPPAVNRAELRQIHSADVVVAQGPGAQGDGDALITNQPGLYISIRTADCVPLLLADPGQRVVAAIHAGWRGTALNIVGRTLDTLVSKFHTDPSKLRAAIGPGIGRCCYEVGRDVAVRFSPWMPELATAGDGAMLDLVEVNRRQLVEAGVWQVETSEACTRCEDQLLHSFRRDAANAGRMNSAIGLR